MRLVRRALGVLALMKEMAGVGMVDLERHRVQGNTTLTAHMGVSVLKYGVNQKSAALPQTANNEVCRTVMSGNKNQKAGQSLYAWQGV